MNKCKTFRSIQAKVKDGNTLQLHLILDDAVDVHATQIDIELEYEPVRSLYQSHVRRLYRLWYVLARTIFTFRYRLVRSYKDWRHKTKGALAKLGISEASIDRKSYFPVIPVDMKAFSGVYLHLPSTLNAEHPTVAYINSVYRINKLLINTSPVLIEKSLIQPWENIVTLGGYRSSRLTWRPVKQIVDPQREILFHCNPLQGALPNYRWRFVVTVYADRVRQDDPKIIPIGSRTPGGLKQHYRQRENPLSLAAGFMTRSINRASFGLYRDLPFGLYDLDHRTFRLFHWTWGDAPVVSALLGIARLRDDPIARKTALSIADRLLTLQITDTQDENLGGVHTGANIDPGAETGFQWSLLPNDASFIAHWAWFPAYRLTGDTRYLEAAVRAADWIGRVLDKHGYVPSWYRLDTGQWQKRIMIDSGFTAEVFRDLYLETGNRIWYDYGTKFMDALLERLDADDGFFHRSWSEEGGTKAARITFSRGQAWVLEGLLAVYEMTGSEKYLDKARQLALRLMHAQNRNGSWDVYLDLFSGECDKGTPVIAYNLLRTCRSYPDPSLVACAKKAIEWCRKHQNVEQDPNARGGLFSRNIGGGIINNFPYIRGSAPYAVAFYALSMLELADLELVSP